MRTLHYVPIALSTLSCQRESAPLKVMTARDGKRLVLIPGGRFRMGSEHASREDAPVHSVFMPSFCIDKQPVANHEFRVFSIRQRHTIRRIPAGKRCRITFSTILSIPLWMSHWGRHLRTRHGPGNGFRVRGIRRMWRIGSTGLSLG